ncbi:hypothetical protein Tco_1144170 [Tanacetum coccineum]
MHNEGDILLMNCRALKKYDYKNKESTRRTVHVEISTSKALVSCDGPGGYDWSDQAKDGPNYATDEFVNKPVIENRKSDEEVSKVVRKSDDYLIIKDWVSDIDCNFPIKKQFQNQRMVKPVWNNAQRVNHQKFAKKTHPCAKKNMVPRAVLMKSGLVSGKTARQVNAAHTKTTMNASRPMSYLSKKAHSTGNPQMDLQDKGVIDSRCSRHVTENMSYLTDYEEIDGGYDLKFGMELKVNVARNKLNTAVKSINLLLLLKVNAARHNLLLLVMVNAVEGLPLLLEVEQDSGNIAKTQSKETPNESSFLGTTLGGGPRRQETMRDTIAQTRFESVSKLSNDPLLARGNTLQSGEDSLKLNELMELCTNLQQRVLDLEKTKTTQAEEIVSLKRRVKKLEQKKRSRTYGLKRLYKVGLTARVESSRDEESLGEDASKQGRINVINADEDITLVNDQDDVDMFDVNTLTGDEVLAEPEVAVKDVNLTVDEVTLAQALAALKSVKPKVKANVVEEPSVPVSAASTKVSAAITITTAIIPTPRKGIVITELGTSTTTTISSQPSHAKVQEKGKGIMVEEPMKSMTKKDLVRLDEEIASKLQAKFDEEERLAREKDETNVALTEE